MKEYLFQIQKGSSLWTLPWPSIFLFISPSFSLPLPAPIFFLFFNFSYWSHFHLRQTCTFLHDQCTFVGSTMRKGRIGSFCLEHTCCPSTLWLPLKEQNIVLPLRQACYYCWPVGTEGIMEVKPLEQLVGDLQD